MIKKKIFVGALAILAVLVVVRRVQLVRENFFYDFSAFVEPQIEARKNMSENNVFLYSGTEFKGNETSDGISKKEWPKEKNLNFFDVILLNVDGSLEAARQNAKGSYEEKKIKYLTTYNQETLLLLRVQAGIRQLKKGELKNFGVEDVKEIDMVDPVSGTTLLIEAIKAKDFSLVDKFLLKKADVNLSDSIGETPLMHVVHVGRKDFSKRFIEAGANVNSKNEVGDTALHVAVAGGDIGLVHLLLKNGADVTPADERGQSPLELAKTLNRFEIVEMLVQFQTNH